MPVSSEKLLELISNFNFAILYSEFLKGCFKSANMWRTVWGNLVNVINSLRKLLSTNNKNCFRSGYYHIRYFNFKI